MIDSIRRGRFRRTPKLFCALSGLLLIVSGCEKLVGISDTEINDAGGGASASTAANAGSNVAEAGKAGQAGADAGGAASGNGGGPTETGGTSLGGASGGRAGSGGSAGGVNGGGAAGKGGSAGTGGTGGGMSGGTGGTGGASECPCSAPKPTCESGKCIVRGPTMVKAADSDYYVDSTEVTSAQWDAFIATKPSTAGQRASCAWNTSFAPSDVTKEDNFPVAYVDFCDAAAYCAWADKRLCGAIDGAGLTATDPAVDMNPDVINPAKSQWYRGCAGPKSLTYPYGDAYIDKACGATDGFDGPYAVQTLPMCNGFYKGIYDMIGNVREWIDACATENGKGDMCAAMGGSIFSNVKIACYNYDLETRDTQVQALGFRCCSK
ncbi:MAG: SUMF1/EgtB/PvdO family nonheme iron enzyme [Pseudomonadota bacterium]